MVRFSIFEPLLSKRMINKIDGWDIPIDIATDNTDDSQVQEILLEYANTHPCINKADGQCFREYWKCNWGWLCRDCQRRICVSKKINFCNDDKIEEIYNQKVSENFDINTSDIKDIKGVFKWKGSLPEGIPPGPITIFKILYEIESAPYKELMTKIRWNGGRLSEVFRWLSERVDNVSTKRIDKLLFNIQEIKPVSKRYRFSDHALEVLKKEGVPENLFRMEMPDKLIKGEKSFWDLIEKQSNSEQKKQLVKYQDIIMKYTESFDFTAYRYSMRQELRDVITTTPELQREIRLYSINEIHARSLWYPNKKTEGFVVSYAPGSYSLPK